MTLAATPSVASVDRPWQQAALDKIRAAEITGKPDFLLVATPGAGKTHVALRTMRRGLGEGRYEFVIVVVPTRPLKRQWARSSANLGIQLDPTFLNRHGDTAADYQGVIVTYAQVAHEPELFRRLMRERSTLVIFDEIHHAGDKQTWGVAIRTAFNAALFRLLLSGTPFREKGFIPFVAYREAATNGYLTCCPDESYGYQKALNDGVCRPVLFASYDGSMTWITSKGVVSADLRDELPEEEARQRLRAALDIKGSWLPGLIREANAELTQIRHRGHADAGGLIVVFEQEDAKRIAPMVERITGEAPIIVVSDDDDAGERLDEFKQGQQRWLIAVKMVSEGEDIPRLRVGVYATRIIAKLFFRQFVGRFVRMIPGIDDQTAFVYIPADAILIEYARQITEEIEHEVRESYEESDPADKALMDAGDAASERLVLFGLIDNSDPRFLGMIHDGQEYSDEDLQAAELMKVKAGVPSWYPAAFTAAVMRACGFTSDAFLQQQPEPVAKEPLDVVKARVKRSCQHLVNGLHKLTGMTHEQINGWLAAEVGGYIHENTLDQLRERERLLLKSVGEAQHASQRPRA